LRPRASLARVQAQRLRKLSPKGSQSHGRFPLGIRTRVVHGPVSSDHQRGRCHRTVSERERSPVQAPVCCGAAGRVTKTVTTVSDSPLSRRVTASHRVIGNPAIPLTRPHGTARHSQLPKLDVAGLILVACSNDGPRERRPGVRPKSSPPTKPRRAPGTSFGEKATVYREAMDAVRIVSRLVRIRSGSRGQRRGAGEAT
jgi:hypothetical protein